MLVNNSLDWTTQLQHQMLLVMIAAELDRMLAVMVYVSVVLKMLAVAVVNL